MLLRLYCWCDEALDEMRNRFRNPTSHSFQSFESVIYSVNIDLIQIAMLMSKVAFSFSVRPRSNASRYLKTAKCSLWHKFFRPARLMLSKTVKLYLTSVVSVLVLDRKLKFLQKFCSCDNIIYETCIYGEG